MQASGVHRTFDQGDSCHSERLILKWLRGPRHAVDGQFPEGNREAQPYRHSYVLISLKQLWASTPQKLALLTFRLVTMPRKVMYPFRFSDGTVVPKDNWLCIPQQAIMEDQQYYDDPSAFNGFRFVRQDDDGRATASDAGKDRLFTTPTFEFPLWGPVRRAWYVPTH